MKNGLKMIMNLKVYNRIKNLRRVLLISSFLLRFVFLFQGVITDPQLIRLIWKLFARGTTRKKYITIVTNFILKLLIISN